VVDLLTEFTSYARVGVKRHRGHIQLNRRGPVRLLAGEQGSGSHFVLLFFSLFLFFFLVGTSAWGVVASGPRHTPGYAGAGVSGAAREHDRPRQLRLRQSFTGGLVGNLHSPTCRSRRAPGRRPPPPALVTTLS